MSEEQVVAHLNQVRQAQERARRHATSTRLIGQAITKALVWFTGVLLALLIVSAFVFIFTVFTGGATQALVAAVAFLAALFASVSSNVLLSRVIAERHGNLDAMMFWVAQEPTDISSTGKRELAIHLAEITEGQIQHVEMKTVAQRLPLWLRRKIRSWAKQDRTGDVCDAQLNDVLGLSSE